jgi:hypothetical protein
MYSIRVLVLFAHKLKQEVADLAGDLLALSEGHLRPLKPLPRRKDRPE